MKIDKQMWYQWYLPFYKYINEHIFIFSNQCNCNICIFEIYLTIL